MPLRERRARARRRRSVDHGAAHLDASSLGGHPAAWRCPRSGSGLLVEALTVADHVSSNQASEAISARLAEIIFLMGVRRALAEGKEPQRWASRAFLHPQIGRAIRALHDQPMRKWTAASVAREVGISRSTFTELFTRLVGSRTSGDCACSSWRTIASRRRRRVGRPRASASSPKRASSPPRTRRSKPPSRRSSRASRTTRSTSCRLPSARSCASIARAACSATAPRLPDVYNRTIDGIRVGPSTGSCGTAAHRRAPVIGESELWADFRYLAERFHLRSCWSKPIFVDRGEVLGTFAVYDRECHEPTAVELAIAEHLAERAAGARGRPGRDPRARMKW